MKVILKGQSGQNNKHAHGDTDKYEKCVFRTWGQIQDKNCKMWPAIWRISKPLDKRG